MRSRASDGDRRDARRQTSVTCRGRGRRCQARRQRPGSGVGDGTVKQVVSGTTRGWHGGDNVIRSEGSDVVEGDGGTPANFSSLTASIAKSSDF
jgi:hypothetical protein